MIIDRILDRKDEGEKEKISVYPEKYNDYYVPATDVYPADAIPVEYHGWFVWKYDPHTFYMDIMGYGEIGNAITAAMDYGNEADVKAALCRYIDEQGYNPDIKVYINSVNWL